MKPRPPKEVKSDDLFRSRLTQIINTRHELARLTEQIDWAHIDQQVQPFFAAEGRPAIPSRLMVGLHILKSMYQLSDEAVCERWVESPSLPVFLRRRIFPA